LCFVKLFFLPENAGDIAAGTKYLLQFLEVYGRIFSVIDCLKGVDVIRGETGAGCLGRLGRS
jgi:hypothetical protein